MHIDIITIFPEIFSSWQATSLIAQACQNDLLVCRFHDLKKFSGRTDGRVDDRPYGGGPGMVLRPDPILRALESIDDYEQATRIHLSPSGKLWTQSQAVVTARVSHLIILCSRYEGVDERAIELGQFEEVSLGDYVVMGGEVPAMMLMESMIRLVPGVVGSESSVLEDSFSSERQGLLDCPHYTRPSAYREKSIPEVLLSGDHEKIKQWRQEQSVQRTRIRRPDLFETGDS